MKDSFEKDNSHPINEIILPLFNQASTVIEQARTTAYRQINETLVRRNWELGRLIAEEELKGADRAKYGYTSGHRTSQKMQYLCFSRRRFLCRLFLYGGRQLRCDSRRTLPDYDAKAITGLALRDNHSANSTCAICHNLIPTFARNSKLFSTYLIPHINQPSATSWCVSSDKTSNRFCRAFAAHRKQSNCTLQPALLAV